MIAYVRHCKAARLTKLQSIFELLMAIRKEPLQKRNMVAIAKKFRFANNQVADIARISLKAYLKMEPSTYLSVGASERIIKLAELYETGIMALESKENFILWLNLRVPVLCGFRPYELISTYTGIDLIKDALLRFEYSIPS